MLLDGRDDRLNEENVSFAAVRLELNFQAIVGEPSHGRGEQRNAKCLTYLPCQFGMSTSAEYSYVLRHVWPQCHLHDRFRLYLGRPPPGDMIQLAHPKCGCLGNPHVPSE